MLYNNAPLIFHRTTFLAAFYPRIHITQSLQANPMNIPPTTHTSQMNSIVFYKFNEEHKTRVKLIPLLVPFPLNIYQLHQVSRLAPKLSLLQITPKPIVVISLSDIRLFANVTVWHIYCVSVYCSTTAQWSSSNALKIRAIWWWTSVADEMGNEH